MDQTNTDVTIEEIEELYYNLDNKEDFEKIDSEIQFNNTFFKPAYNVIYKINLTSAKIIPITKTFKHEGEADQVAQKYALEIHSTDKDRNVFEGVWEIGSGTLRKILDCLKESQEKVTETYFKLKKSGSGLNTTYDVISEDF